MKSSYLILFILVIGFTSCKQEKITKKEKKLQVIQKKLQVIQKELQSIDDIETLDSLVKPIDYTNVISLSDLSVADKKSKFIDLLLPAILIAKQKQEARRIKVLRLSKKDSLSISEQGFLEKLKTAYKATDLDDLQNRLLTHPTSLILAQASLESGWGKSRFFREGRNIFGVWSVNKNEPRMQTKSHRNGKYMYVKKYNSISESIEDYFKTLGKSNAYKRFRKTRAKTNDPYEISNTLNLYSEQRWEYVAKLKRQIRHNRLEQFDSYVIDSIYYK